MKNGKVKPHKMGNAIIKVSTRNDITATCSVTCGIKPTELKLNKSEVTLSVSGNGENPKEFQITT